MQDCLQAKFHLRSDHCRMEPSSASGGHCPLGGDIQTLDIAPDPRPRHLPTPLLLVLIIQAANIPRSNCKTAFYAHTRFMKTAKQSSLWLLGTAPFRKDWVWCHKRVHLILSSSLSKKFKTAARLVLLAPRQHHSTPPGKTALASISERIKYKVACMCFNAINGSGPAYLSV